MNFTIFLNMHDKNAGRILPRMLAMFLSEGGYMVCICFLFLKILFCISKFPTISRSRIYD